MPKYFSFFFKEEVIICSLSNCTVKIRVKHVEVEQTGNTSMCRRTYNIIESFNRKLCGKGQLVRHRCRRVKISLNQKETKLWIENLWLCLVSNVWHSNRGRGTANFNN